MTNFDPLDALLRKTLKSEAVPSEGFTDRVMEAVAATPQEKKTARRYVKWLVSAAACVVIVGAALPLLQGGSSADSEAYNTSGTDTAMPYVNDEVNDETVADSEAVEKATALPTDAMTVDGAAPEQKSRSADLIQERLESAAEALSRQGYTLEVVADDGEAVQVAVSSEEHDGETAQQALCDAMTANGFVERDGWYVVAEEVTP